MRFAVYLPNFGTFADPAALVEVASTAEAFGWDGVFLWDHILADPGAPFIDPWVGLAAIATATERIRLGALVTPLPRRRPWVVARQAVSLDHLSGGRLVFGAGIGGDGWREYSAFGEEPDAKRHGAMLDEALAVIDGLWSGEAFSFAGEHYTIRDAQFLPRPVQQPRIPVWIAAMWPGTRPLRRAAQWDGVFPLGKEQDLLPQDIRAIREEIARHRTVDTPFDIAVNGRVFAPDFTEHPVPVPEHRDAGVTWWLDAYWGNVPLERVLATIRQGPPHA